MAMDDSLTYASSDSEGSSFLGAERAPKRLRAASRRRSSEIVCSSSEDDSSLDVPPSDAEVCRLSEDNSSLDVPPSDAEAQAASWPRTPLAEGSATTRGELLVGDSDSDTSSDAGVAGASELELRLVTSSSDDGDGDEDACASCASDGGVVAGDDGDSDEDAGASRLRGDSLTGSVDSTFVSAYSHPFQWAFRALVALQYLMGEGLLRHAYRIAFLPSPARG